MTVPQFYQGVCEPDCTSVSSACGLWVVGTAPPSPPTAASPQDEHTEQHRGSPGHCLALCCRTDRGTLLGTGSSPSSRTYVCRRQMEGLKETWSNLSGTDRMWRLPPV